MARTFGLATSLAIAVQTAAAMVAFAANSLLCRIALANGLIDAPSFASLRIASGALLLVWLAHGESRGAPRAPTDWAAAASLAAYILPFTLAYLTLGAGSGALLLFGAAQLTMLGVGLYRGERPAPLGWCGLAAASAGFVLLLAPGADGVPLAGGALMTAAGVAWGVYSLRGRASRQPLRSTAQNFLFTLPWVLAINLAFAGGVHWSATGVALALASGTLASALGYVVWYSALPRLSAIAAGTVQLSVPVIAALGGVLLLDERLTWRLGACGLAILGGIALVGRPRAAPVSAV
jgi:drug/metabolite transporter (DMT)-like permease